MSPGPWVGCWRCRGMADGAKAPFMEFPGGASAWEEESGCGGGPGKRKLHLLLLRVLLWVGQGHGVGMAGCHHCPKQDTEVLDSAMYRSRANLGRKRGHRAPAIRPGGTLGLSEAAESDARLFQDSTGRGSVFFGGVSIGVGVNWAQVVGGEGGHLAMLPALTPSLPGLCRATSCSGAIFRRGGRGGASEPPDTDVLGHQGAKSQPLSWPEPVSPEGIIGSFSRHVQPLGQLTTLHPAFLLPILLLITHFPCLSPFCSPVRASGDPFGPWWTLCCVLSGMEGEHSVFWSRNLRRSSGLEPCS